MDKNKSTIISELVLLQSQTVAFMLVEGDFDYKFWQSKIHDIMLINCQGCKNVIDVVNSSKEIKKPVFGTIDRDYGKFGVCMPYHHNLFYTDKNDLEVSLLYSGVFNNIKNCCDIVNLKSNNISYDIKHVLKASMLFGILRIINKVYGFEFPFHRFTIRKYLNEELKFDKKKLFKDFCEKCNISMDDLVRKASMIYIDIDWDLLRGHDCVAELTVFLQNYGVEKKNNLNSLLLISSDVKMLLCLEMVVNINRWLKAHGIQELHLE